MNETGHFYYFIIFSSLLHVYLKTQDQNVFPTLVDM
jgi:hypothetical protein